jgi:VanZ family protein
MSRAIAPLVEAALRVPRTLRWLAVVAWGAMIFLASNQQGLAVSDDPGVDRPLRGIAHVGVFGVLTVFLAWALCGRRIPTWRTTVTAGGLAFAYGISDEWHQTMVPTRSGRPEDLVWDALGVAVAVAVITLVGAASRRGYG